jgi:hypothetical protein
MYIQNEVIILIDRLLIVVGICIDPICLQNLYFKKKIIRLPAVIRVMDLYSENYDIDTGFLPPNDI